MSEQEPCTRDDLVALIPQYNRWSLDENGRPQDFEDSGDIGGDFEDIDEFLCNNCCNYFTPEKSEGRSYATSAEVELAWQAALDHLPTVRAGDGRLVRVEVAS